MEISSTYSTEVAIHKSDGVTKHAAKVKIMDNGCLAVWDTLETQEEPDIVVKEDKWERVEREGHSWRQTSTESVMEEARRRDDVDEDKVAEQL